MVKVNSFVKKVPSHQISARQRIGASHSDGDVDGRAHHRIREWYCGQPIHTVLYRSTA